MVIELSIKAIDELAMSVTVDAGPELSDGVGLDPDEDKQLFMGPELVEAIKNRLADRTMQMSESIGGIEDIGSVVIERITYAGQGRDGVFKRIRLSADTPRPPAGKTPDKVEIGPDGSLSELYDVLPWPENISWTVTDDNKLKVVCGEKTLELAVGESGMLAVIDAEIPVTIEEVDDTADIPDGDDVKLPTVKRDLGKVKFSAAISVRWLGRLKITEDEQ
jgi:hypothetical protein